MAACANASFRALRAFQKLNMHKTWRNMWGIHYILYTYIYMNVCVCILCNIIALFIYKYVLYSAYNNIIIMYILWDQSLEKGLSESEYGMVNAKRDTYVYQQWYIFIHHYIYIYMLGRIRRVVNIFIDLCYCASWASHENELCEWRIKKLESFRFESSRKHGLFITCSAYLDYSFLIKILCFDGLVNKRVSVFEHFDSFWWTLTHPHVSEGPYLAN